jgi:RNA polymerase sigma-70 factor, ECF subfamily
MDSLTLNDIEATDEDAFAGFYSDERLVLFRSLLLLTGDRIEAEDLAQEAFVRIYERWSRIRRMEGRRGYLYATAYNLHRKSLRRRLRRTASLIPIQDVDEDFSQRSVDKMRVMAALRKLALDQRQTVILVDFVDMAPTDVARVLRISPEAVRARLHRARMAVRKEISTDE